MMADFEIAYTFGFEPLQQFLVEFPGGRLQALIIRRWPTPLPSKVDETRLSAGRSSV